MTDKRIKEDCPFCGHDKSDIQLYLIGHDIDGYLVEVSCPECGVKIIGCGKQNTIDKWNRRYR